jgi:hypothetical protein
VDVEPFLAQWGLGLRATRPLRSLDMSKLGFAFIPIPHRHDQLPDEEWVGSLGWSTCSIFSDSPEKWEFGGGPARLLNVRDRTLDRGER